MDKKKKFDVKDLDLYYGDFQALKKINIDIYENEVTALSVLLAVVNLHFCAA